MAKYNCFLKEAVADTLTTHTGGTTLEILGRTLVELTSTTEPVPTGKSVSDATIGHKLEARFTLAAGLAEDIAGGGKVVAIVVHFMAKSGEAASVRFKLGFVSPAVTEQPTLAATQSWVTLALSKGQSEAFTTAKALEELTALVETSVAKTWTAYEIYLTVETGAGGTEVKTVTAAVHGAGNTAAASLKVAAATASIHGAGATTAASSKVATPQAAVHGAGNVTAASSKIASLSAAVHGAGKVNATSGSTEVKTVVAAVHGAGRTAALTLKIGLAEPAVHGAGRTNATSSRIALATSKITSAGRATSTTSRIGLATAAVHGAGRVTAVVAHEAEHPDHCSITLTSQPALTITLSSRAALTISLETQ